jgi:hypothetical protein
VLRQRVMMLRLLVVVVLTPGLAGWGEQEAL